MTGLADGELETAAEMTAAVKAGEVTAVELADRAIRRADAWQPVTNAFSQLWAERALEQAKDVGPGAGVLAGVPVTIKDLFDVAGEEASGCCRAYAGSVASRDATVVARVLSAGAVPIGKTNQHELAAGGTNLVSACGPTRNPWDPSRMTGGSSGGAGVTVATGIVALALGSDTGGSVRIPASMCGTFGLKPSFGRLPTDGVMPLAPSMDCPGPLASTVADLSLLFEVMAGPVRRRTGDGPFRIAPVGGFFGEDVAAECLRAVEDLLRVLGSAGVQIAERLGEDPESKGVFERARHVWNRTCFPEFAAAHQRIDRSLVSDQPRLWMEQGERYSRRERQEAAGRRAGIRSWFIRELEHADALVVPTCAYPPPRADQDRVEIGPDRSVEVEEIGPGWLTCTVNLAGLPALSIPSGRSADGLPIGVSLIGRPDEEQSLLTLASMWEGASRYRPALPSLPGDGARA